MARPGGGRELDTPNGRVSLGADGMVKEESTPGAVVTTGEMILLIGGGNLRGSGEYEDNEVGVCISPLFPIVTGGGGCCCCGLGGGLRVGVGGTVAVGDGTTVLVVTGDGGIGGGGGRVDAIETVWLRVEGVVGIGAEMCAPIRVLSLVA